MLFGCNRVWEIVPDLAVLYACNEEFWSHYWCDQLLSHPAHKWTTNRVAARKFNLNLVAEKSAKGLSSTSTVIHHGHGSGYSLINLAYLMGASRIILLGYDLRYAADYDGSEKRVGSTPRHYFGEYPSALMHWPKTHVKDGVHVELLDLYRSVAKQGLIEIVNCTGQNSALDCFPRMDIDAV